MTKTEAIFMTRKLSAGGRTSREIVRSLAERGYHVSDRTVRHWLAAPDAKQPVADVQPVPPELEYEPKSSSWAFAPLADVMSIARSNLPDELVGRLVRSVLGKAP